MLNQICRSSLSINTKRWSGGAPWQVFKVDAHVDIGHPT